MRSSGRFPVMIAGVALAAAACHSVQPSVFPITSAESVDGRRLDQAPRLVEGSCQAPTVPVMQAAGDSAVAVLTFVLDTLGTIEPGSVTVQSATIPELADPARAAIATCRYEPGRIAGHGVRSRVVNKIRFRTP